MNNGDGTFRTPVIYTYSKNSYAVVTGDFNGDGKPDFAIVSRQGQTAGVGILLGIGDGTFKPIVPYLAGQREMALAIADFNGDGKRRHSRSR